jgi:hypothetical protein
MVDGGFLLGFLWGLESLVCFIFPIFCLRMTPCFFVRQNLERLRYMRALFLCFEAVFGLKINLTKSELVLVGNVNNVNGLANILGCTVSSLLVNYLGLLLGASFKAKYIWDGIIEKIERRLARWRHGDHLSLLPFVIVMEAQML